MPHKLKLLVQNTTLIRGEKTPSLTSIPIADAWGIISAGSVLVSDLENIPAPGTPHLLYLLLWLLLKSHTPVTLKIFREKRSPCDACVLHHKCDTVGVKPSWLRSEAPRVAGAAHATFINAM